MEKYPVVEVAQQCFGISQEEPQKEEQHIPVLVEECSSKKDLVAIAAEAFLPK